MEKFFNIRMNVPLGCRDGTLSFAKCGEHSITGMLSLFQNRTPFTGRLMPDGEITFSGQIITLIRTFAYQAQGKVEGNHIDLAITGEQDRFLISGQEVTP